MAMAQDVMAGHGVNAGVDAGVDAGRRLSPMVRWKGRIARRLTSAWRPYVLYLQGAAGTPADVQAAVQAFAQWGAAHEGAVCRVALSSRWLLCHASPASADGSPRTRQDAQALHRQALQHWSHYHDLDEASLQADWVHRQVQHGDASLALAAPRALVDGLREQARAHGVQLASLLPWWVPAVQARLIAEDGAHPDEPTSGTTQSWALIEPAWATHLSVLCLPDADAGVVQAVWGEAMEEGASPRTGAATAVLRLPLPHAPDQASSPLWEADAGMQAALSGRSAWQAVP